MGVKKNALDNSAVGKFKNRLELLFEISKKGFKIGTELAT